MKKRSICFVIMLIMMLFTCFYSVYGANVNRHEISAENYNEDESSDGIKNALDKAKEQVEQNNEDSKSNDVGTNLGLGNLENYKGGNTGSTGKVEEKVGEVLGYIRVIGTIVSVGVLMVLGIKFMVGSVEEKASYKHSFIPYLVGAGILFTGTLLPEAIYNWAHNLG